MTEYSIKSASEITANQIVQNMSLSNSIVSTTENGINISKEIENLAKSEIDENVKRELKLFQLLVQAQPDRWYHEELEKAADEGNVQRIEYLVNNDSKLKGMISDIQDFVDYLDVNEVHISDENGILLYSNIPPYIGFDFESGDQSRPFMEALTNKDFILVQEAQKNVREGVMRQYTGIARLDKPGIIQIGFQPEDLGKLIERINTLTESLTNLRKNVQLQTFVENTIVPEDGFVVVLDSLGNVIAHTDKSYIGKNHLQESYYDKIKSNELVYEYYDGSPYYLYSKDVKDKKITVFVPPDRIHNDLFNIILIVGGGLILMSALIIVLSIFISNRTIIKPVVNMQNAVKELSTGNLTLQIDIDSNDEIGDLSRGINDLVSRFSSVISSVIMSVMSFVNATKEIASGNQDLSQRTSEEASSLEETASAIDEISTTISDTAVNAKSAKELTEKVQQTMNDLEDSSTKMQDIINVIEDIAFRTNLLALNASIEAARAGDSGKGFEVVAIEVKELSQQSSGQAKEIAQIVGDSIDKIRQNAELVENIVQVVTKISNASLEQNDQIKQINNAIEQLNNVTQQNASLVEQSAAASDEISQEAQELNQQVSYFKVKIDKEKKLTGETNKKNNKEITELTEVNNELSDDNE
jgi:methyl-accepting chemotaxis protein